MAVFFFLFCGLSFLCFCGIHLQDADALTTMYIPRLDRSQSYSVSISTTLGSSQSIAEDSSSSSISSSTNAGDNSVILNTKDIVRLFGRLAEKYIALDASAGKCCYSGCSDCEFRLPGGGYRMAEQTAARPKWIPTYDARATASTIHSTKWNTSLFPPDSNNNSNNNNKSKPLENIALSKQEFIKRIQAMDYVPPLGGPYVGVSAASFETTIALERLYQILTQNESYPLTRQTMKKQLEVLAEGEEGISWTAFERLVLLWNPKPAPSL